MNKLLILLAMLALAGCGDKRLKENELAVPTWACAQTPTGLSRTVKVNEYCGKSCYREVEKTEYSIKVACEYLEWRK